MSIWGKRSFSAGEIAPAIYPRTDMVKHSTGVRTMKNFFVKKHGGASNRPGTVFVRECLNQDESSIVRLIPYRASFAPFAQSNTVVEVGVGYASSIYEDDREYGAAVLGATITSGNPITINKTSHGLSDGDYIVTSAYYELFFRPLIVTNATANTFQLTYLDGTNVDDSTLTAAHGAIAYQEVISQSFPSTLLNIDQIHYTQNAYSMILTHTDFAPRTIVSSYGALTIGSQSFTPSISPPTISSGSGAGTFSYVVTAVKDETYEESVISNELTSLVGTTTIISWSGVSGAVEYNVYKRRDSGSYYGFIGTTRLTSFSDNSITQDETYSPPITRNPFSSVYPATVGFFQQKLIFASTTSEPETIYTSRTGQFTNFTNRSPSLADDALTFKIVGGSVNTIRHIIDIGALVVLTKSGEWTVTSGSDGAFTPTNINPRQQSYNGSNYLQPIVIDTNAIYIQEAGSIVRDLTVGINIDGYTGNDLTVFSSHLFKNNEIKSWCYQKSPHSIVWAVRGDGVLLGLTYIKEQQIIAWHRHDTDGVIERVCCLPGTLEDEVYLVVGRTIDGTYRRYIEKLSNRDTSDSYLYNFCDSAKVFDGRSSESSGAWAGFELTLTGGTNWDEEEYLTLTASDPYFDQTYYPSSLTVGNFEIGTRIHFYPSDGTILELEITAIASTTSATVRPNKTVSSELRGTAQTNFARTWKTVRGLWHLNGKDVSVYADGNVVASPNNPEYDTITVTQEGGDYVAELDAYYSVINIGLPFVSDIETLDIDEFDEKKIITSTSAHIEETRGLFYGSKPPSETQSDKTDGLDEYRGRDENDGYYESNNITDKISVNISGQFNNNGRLFIRNVDPTPASVNAVIVEGRFRQGGN